MLFPGPVPRAARRLRGQDGLHEHRRAHRRTAARGSSSRSPARCCSTSRPARWASTRPSCAGATCCAATSCRTRTRTACPTTTSRRSRRSSRRSRCSTTRRSAPSRPRRARPAATSASACPTTSSRRRPASAPTRTEAATIRIEPSGTVNVYIAGGSTGNSIETTVVQLAADALGVEHRRRQHDPGRHRASPASAPARPAAAAGR